MLLRSSDSLLAIDAYRQFLRRNWAAAIAGIALFGTSVVWSSQVDFVTLPEFWITSFKYGGLAGVSTGIVWAWYFFHRTGKVAEVFFALPVFCSFLSIILLANSLVILADRFATQPSTYTATVQWIEDPESRKHRRTNLCSDGMKVITAEQFSGTGICTSADAMKSVRIGDKIQVEGRVGFHVFIVEGVRRIK